METWEYKVIYGRDTPLSEDRFNKLGEEGWELVAITFSDNNGIYDAVFKRPKE